MPSAGGTNFHPQSGHPGVTWCSERRTWRICYAPEPGKRVTKSFNPRHYGGLEQALQAAIEYLREQKAKLSLYRPNGNSNKGENSASINIKKMNDKLNDIHHSSASVLEVDMNNKCGGKHSGSNWNSSIPYNGFEYGSGLGNSELNNINGELLPGFDGGKVANMNQNLFGLENSSEQWNAAAAAVIAHAITTSKSNGVNQKRKANCEYSASMRAPSTKASKSSNLYGEHTYFNSQSSQTNIEMSGMSGYCCECYYSNNSNNSSNNLGSNSTNVNGGSKTNDEQNPTISNQMDNNMNNNIHCNNGQNHLIGHNSFHQYSCSQSSKSTVSTNNTSNSNNNLGNGNNNSIHPFIYDYNDQSNVNDLMNIRTPKYVNYQRHSGNQNLDDDLLHPSIASSSPLGKVFQSTPYSSIDNYDTILTPNMRSGNSQNHSSGLNINNSGRYYGVNSNIFESDGGVPTNSNKSSNNNINKAGYNNNSSNINGNNNTITTTTNNNNNNNINNNNGNNSTNLGCNHPNQINPSYSSCNNCISNAPQNEFGDFNTPYSSWFEGLGSCYSEIEDTFLNKSSHLLPAGSLGPYSFQPYKEQSHSDVSGKSIVESILLPLSTTSCGTSAEPQLSNDLILDSCQNINLYQNNVNTVTSNSNSKSVCLNDTDAI
ncbi:AP2 domain-containing [Cryptosporidium sp. chipmunk genotype I]|uniref:AP2 domain-containing n=1 Tax=Cryptosporidium sp. chipmunk genotype I TaxID=1280935 RepID=UPI00351A05F9|nr:AP2 domain-containing [Cryptosporidium sp. chipmunk genotype I]